MEFKREITIDKPIDQVWEVLGNQFGQAAEWATGLYHSNGFGQPRLPSAPHNNRACDTSQGKIKEVIRVFDPVGHVLEYEVIEGFPFFVASGVNNWRLRKQGASTKVDMHLVIQTKGFVGAVMSPMMKMQMNKITSTILGDFKHYVETGLPSPAKARELAKRAQKAG